MTCVDGLYVAAERIRPWYPRVLRAFAACIDAGKVPTPSNVANEIVPRMSRQAVHAMFLRHPDLLPWINRHLSDTNPHYLGAIVRRTANLALQGSDRHIELYLKHMAGGFALPARGDVPPGAGPTINAGTVIFNSLVPRPEYPALPAIAVATPAPSEDLKLIPTVGAS